MRVVIVQPEVDKKQVSYLLSLPVVFSHLLVFGLYGIGTTSSSDKQKLSFGSSQAQKFHLSKLELVHLQSASHSHVLK